MRPPLADLQKWLQTRSHFLHYLRTPRQKSELGRELDESRSTIDRALRELERAGFVERTRDGYRTTLVGKLALAEYDRYSERLLGLAELRTALADLPPDTPLDAALLEDASVSVPTQHSPQEPVSKLESILSDVTDARVFASAIIPRYVDIYGRRLRAGMDATFLFATEVTEWLLERRSEEFRSLLQVPGVTVGEVSETLPFSLVLFEHADSDGTPTESVGVMLYDDGAILGFVHNDTAPAVAWGESLFARLRAGAESLGTE
ncbi:helix-turn-helix transcriptional regulator [Halorussus halophilus]|uniref:helix-turn-helix transcriptional regulator n=1 Tax=Halorussus halophilus TaxID=2650975 RepID=UPI0017884769|nr:helix-turn-helix domain-containing protein [Halorussus halophilus]